MPPFRRAPVSLAGDHEITEARGILFSMLHWRIRVEMVGGQAIDEAVTPLPLHDSTPLQIYEQKWDYNENSWLTRHTKT